MLLHFLSLSPDHRRNLHLFHVKRVLSANEFLWPTINHGNEPHPEKIINYIHHKSQ